jgi:hypothetical protein
MSTRRPLRGLLARVVLAASVILVGAPIPAAAAAKVHPSVSEYAWYWEDQRSDTIKGPGDTEIVEWRLQNPYCPETPAGGVQELCKAGRLPIEVRAGDYKEPNKISAVSFDFTLVPFGSKVKKFTVTLTEAQDEQSEPMNAANKSLRACRITEFFGTGEAREYKEAPEFKCTKSDPTARRKAVGKGDDKVFEYTFDLTGYAKSWAKQGSLITSVMLYPVKPKRRTATGGIGFGDEQDEEEEASDNWRVVLKGPREKQGIQTTLVFTKPKLERFGPPTTPPTTTDFTGGTTGSDFPSTGTTDFSSAPTTGTGSATTPSTTTPSALPTPTPAPSPIEALDDEPASASAEETPVEGFPWYMWLALVAGIVGFSMVRSIVVERVTGIRPDGVLAHIHRLSADRRGMLTQAAGGPGLLAPLATVLAPVGRGLTAFGRSAAGLLGKVRRKG